MKENGGKSTATTFGITVALSLVMKGFIFTKFGVQRCLNDHAVGVRESLLNSRLFASFWGNAKMKGHSGLSENNVYGLTYWVFEVSILMVIKI